MTELTSMELCEANREKLLAWYDEGRSYWWMGQAIGIPDCSRSVVSQWFIRQGIRRKAVK